MRQLWLGPAITTAAEAVQLPGLLEGLTTFNVVAFGFITLITGMSYGIAIALWYLRRG